MNVPIKLEDCFRADEIRRIGLAIQYGRKKERERALELIRMDYDLPDYRGELQSYKRQKDKASIIRILRYLLP